MNHFKIGGRQYRAEITVGDHGSAFFAKIKRWDPWYELWMGDYFTTHMTRPAARRALKREIERLATDWRGKRANWTIARGDRRAAWDRVVAAAARATGAFGGLGLAAIGAGRAMAALREPLHKFAEVNR